MHTARLPSVRVSVIRSQYQLGGPQMNKFEKVSCDGHQMSLTGCWGFQCLMSEAVGPGGDRTIHCGPMHHGCHMGTTPVDKQTDTSEYITFPQLWWLEVIRKKMLFRHNAQLLLNIERLHVTAETFAKKTGEMVRSKYTIQPCPAVVSE